MKMNKGSVMVVGIIALAVAVALILRQVVPAPLALPEVPQATAVAPMDLTTAEGTVYILDPTRSEAQFIIHEILMDVEAEVMGKSNQVTGQIAFSVETPQTARVGEIVIDARSLLTDNNLRNRALASQILQTTQFQWIRFTPTQLRGLPESAVVGQTYPLEIVGALEIIGQRREVTFTAEVTLLSDVEIAGHASTTIAYADFGVVIPAATLVQAVADEVVLVLDFTAVSPP